MGFSELLKNFDKVRDYMREFYGYGFKTRNDFDQKSARSYDNEKRRVESWLSDYMSFRQSAQGKQMFLSVDSRKPLHNPLYRAFKAKSFTDKDIMLHFYLLDILKDGTLLTTGEIVSRMTDDYFSFFESEQILDESTVRKKLKEYVELGLLYAIKKGKEVKYGRMPKLLQGETLPDAIAFAAEANPLGVVGSYLLDQYEYIPEYFSFKHRYLLVALEQEILLDLLLAKKNHNAVELEIVVDELHRRHICKVYPLRIYISTQNGKQYLMAYNYQRRRPRMYRLDHIRKVQMLEEEANAQLLESYAEAFAAHLWGTSGGNRKDRQLEQVSLTLHREPGAEYIANRLQRESRGCTVYRVDAQTVQLEANVYDAMEMVPWLRTFIGRIERFCCSNTQVEQLFYQDMNAMIAMYGGDSDAL